MAFFPIMLAVASLSLAGLVQGTTGFGFGLVAMALLPAFLDLHSVSMVVVLYTIPVSAMTLVSIRRYYSWRAGLGLMLGLCCGLPLGVYVLVSAPQELLIRLLGAVMLAFAAREFAPLQTKPRLPAAMSFPLGIMSGVLGGAFNMGGPPAVAYLYSQPWPKEQVVAILQVVFLLSATIRLILLSGSGLLTTEVMHLSLYAALPVLAGVLLGVRCFHRLEQASLRRGVFLFVGAMGCKYLLWP